MHALIIEDDAMIAMSIEQALRDCGFATFDFADSLETAVRAAGEGCPDLITADVRLARGCGVEAVQVICQEKAIPVIFLTGSWQEVEARLPGYALLRKPFTGAQISEVVRKLFDSSPESPSPKSLAA